VQSNIICIDIKLKKKYHAVGTVSKFNRQIIKRRKIDKANT